MVECYGLCFIVIGLEQVDGVGMVCFGCQICCCCGVCIGEEMYEQYQQCLMQVLEDLCILFWFYVGLMVLVEQGDGWQQVYVIDYWCYLGLLDWDNC